MIARKVPEFFDEYCVINGRVVKLVVKTDYVRSLKGYPHGAMQRWHSDVAQAQADAASGEDPFKDREFQDAVNEFSKVTVDRKFNRSIRHSELY